MPLRISRHTTLLASVCLVAGIALGIAVPGVTAEQDNEPDYEVSGDGVRLLERGSGPNIRLLVDATNLAGAELELGEIEFPADYKPSPPHTHRSVEIFYITSGELGHTVNGVKNVIKPGMVGIVRPGDTVIHSVESDEPVKGLIIWTPGGEADRLVKFGVFKSTPL